MLNHTYTSVKNANLVDCGKKQHIPSQPSPLLRDNFLGEYRTELDKKKVLANLGIATELSLEWEYIKGDISRSKALVEELDTRTKYISELDGFNKSVIDGIKYLESIIGGEQDSEEEQNRRLTSLESASKELTDSLNELKVYLEQTIEVNINTLEESLKNITEKVNNITDLIQVSSKAGNALSLLTSEDVEEGVTPGLYVPDLSEEVSAATGNIEELQKSITSINESLEDFVTKEELGGGSFDFVDQSDFDTYTKNTNTKFSELETELLKTVKTGEDGHVDTLYVNKISKNNEGNIIITDSFEMDSNSPLDVRFVVENLDELLSLPVKICYSGMGVIVNSLSSLYILRKPAEGVIFNQEYIANSNNWKCPEDLVTVAITRDEYENLEEVNPNVFYYIYEEDIELTKEPVREDYLTEEEFQTEWQKWVNSLKVLSQEYMSASWGIDIEKKLSEKASNSSVLQLSNDIKALQGGEDGISLKTLNTAIENLKASDENIKNNVNNILTIVDGEESGRLVIAENNIENIQNNLENYVSKDYIQDESNNFIFVKDSVYQEDKTNLENSLKTQITTKQIISEEAKTDKLVLNESTLVVADNKLMVDDSILATTNEVPKILVLTQEEYDTLEQKNSETYYYTFDDDEIYITKSVLDEKIKTLNSQMKQLQNQINLLEQRISSQEQN